MKRGPLTETVVAGHKVRVQVYIDDQADRIKAVALVTAAGSSNVVHESVRESIIGKTTTKAKPPPQHDDVVALVLADVAQWAKEHPAKG